MRATGEATIVCEELAYMSYSMVKACQTELNRVMTDPASTTAMVETAKKNLFYAKLTQLMTETQLIAAQTSDGENK